MKQEELDGAGSHGPGDWCNPHTGFPLLGRVAVLATIVAAVFISFATYQPQDIGRLYPPPNIIANTWYGPILVLLIPVALGWIALSVKRKWLKVLVLSLSVLLLLACLDWIYVVRQSSGTLPEFIPHEQVL